MTLPPPCIFFSGGLCLSKKNRIHLKLFELYALDPLKHTGHFVQPHVAAHCGGPEHTRATCGGDMWRRHVAATCGGDMWRRHVCYVCKRSVCGGDEPQPVAHLSHKLQCARQSFKIMVSYGNKYRRHNARPHVAEQSGQCARALNVSETKILNCDQLPE